MPWKKKDKKNAAGQSIDNVLPNDLVADIASKLSLKNASMLKMTSKKMHKIVSETHPSLPLRAPSYDAGTGKYQAQFEEIKEYIDPLAFDVDDDDAIVELLSIYNFVMETKMYGIETMIEMKSVNSTFKSLFNEIQATLKKWKTPRYKKALKVIRKKPNHITAQDKEMYGSAIFDAVVMVSVKRMRNLVAS